MTVYGCDLSNHDWDRHPLALADIRQAGISLVTHKATEGDWYQDPYLGMFTHQLAADPFPVEGTYHVLNHGINVANQVDYWVGYVKSKAPWWNRRPAWIWQLDCEPLDGYAAPTEMEILAAGQRLQKTYHIPADNILVYGPEWVYGDRLKGLPYRLWSSHYVNGSGPYRRLYPGDRSASWGAYSGQTPLVLQFSSTTVIGGQYEVDADAVRVSSEAALQALFSAPNSAPQDLLTGLDTMTPAERQALITDIADEVFNRKFISPIDKTPYTFAQWVVWANVRASESREAALELKDTLVPAVQSAVSGLAAKIGAIDTAGIAADIKSRVIKLLGGS